MSEPTKKTRSIEGYYNYYGIPAYVLKQKNGSFASGYYDWIEGVFKAGGSVKKILWDVSDRYRQSSAVGYGLP